MRLLALAAVASGWVFAAAPLAIVQPAISIMEAGTPDLPGAVHVPGETVYFSCRILNYTKNPDDKVRLAYSVQAFDPAGVPLAEPSHNGIEAEVSFQDKNWRPRIETEVVIPPLVPSGVYRITVKVEDLVAKTSAQLDAPLRVRGHIIQPGAALTVQNLQLFRASGTVLWKQTEPAVERSESFYPKRYIPADFGLNLDKKIRPGEYAITITVKDGVGSQTYETRQPFTVE
ncbi:MAG: hypothetical protein ABSH45_17330 [Bryobacteraceae bacterium]